MAKKIDPKELIDSTQAAELLGLSRFNAISTYRRRYPDFPRPTIERGRCILWLRADIETWQASRS